MSDDERVATVESELRHLREDMTELRTDMREVKQALSGYKGVVAGIVLTVSFAWGMGLAVWQVLKDKIA